MSTVNDSNAKPSAKSEKKAPTVSPLVIALQKALAKAEKAKPAQLFEETPLYKALTDKKGNTLGGKDTQSILDFAKKKHEEQHGDTGKVACRELLAIIAPALGGLETVAEVARDMAKGEREKGKVTATAKEFRDALSGEKGARADLLPIAEKAAELRKEGKAWSEIETVLKLSENTRQALYMVSQEFTDLFTAKK